MTRSANDLRREYRRVLLDDLPRWRGEGWAPAVDVDGAVGAVPICDGMLAEVLIWRDAGPSAFGRYLCRTEAITPLFVRACLPVRHTLVVALVALTAAVLVVWAVAS